MPTKTLSARMACPPSPTPCYLGKVCISLFQAPVGKGSKTKSLRWVGRESPSVTTVKMMIFTDNHNHQHQHPHCHHHQHRQFQRLSASLLPTLKSSNGAKTGKHWGAQFIFNSSQPLHKGGISGGKYLISLNFCYKFIYIMCLKFLFKCSFETSDIHLSDKLKL